MPTKIEAKIEAFYRDATDMDVAEIVRTNNGKVARFREDKTQNWVCLDVDGYDLTLVGWDQGHFKCDEGMCWSQCQVYEPQSWWLKKPEPGKGYTLLGKYPHEPLQANDEWWDGVRWVASTKSTGEQLEAIWYRRKQEQTKPAADLVAKLNDRILLPNGRILTVTANGIEIE